MMALKAWFFDRCKYPVLFLFLAREKPYDDRAADCCENFSLNADTFFEMESLFIRNKGYYCLTTSRFFWGALEPLYGPFNQGKSFAE